jgi:hypothetical protein
MIRKILFVLMCVFTMCYSEDISVHLNRSFVRMDESFSIQFTSEQKVNGQPDFSPLKQDFDILSTGKSNNTSIINGSVKQQVSWNLEVVPKREGKLTIPSITFGNYQSAPHSIEVIKNEDAKKDASIYLETEIAPKQGVYAQSQLIYTVRLFRSVNLLQGTLSDVKVNDPDAMIEKLGNDVEFQKDQYIVLERKYAIYPQHEGKLIISPVVFEGKIIIGGNTFFNVHSQYKRVSSNEVTVDVKPIPSPFQKNNWLAAYDVKLTEEWSIEPPQMKVGEPITWTLKVTADGCLGNQIPHIALNFPEEIKQYEDKPLIENRGNEGTRQMKIALIASKSGEIKIPEVAVKWWDLKNDKIRETLLPARTIDVVAVGPVVEEPQIITSEAVQELPWWAWGLIGLNSIWILGLVVWLAQKCKIRQPDLFKGSHLKNACNVNDAKQAEMYLLQWAEVTFPNEKFLSINEIKSHVNETLQEAIDDLYQNLYGKKQNWQGDSLWQAVKGFKAPKRPERKKGDPILKSLY